MKEVEQAGVSAERSEAGSSTVVSLEQVYKNSEQYGTLRSSELNYSIGTYPSLFGRRDHAYYFDMTVIPLVCFSEFNDLVLQFLPYFYLVCRYQVSSDTDFP